MNIYELEKQATPGKMAPLQEGPYSYLTADRHAIAGAIMNSRMITNKEANSTFLLVSHCRNNFFRALEALKEEHTSHMEENDGMHLMGACPVCNLIKELETVKE